MSGHVLVIGVDGTRFDALSADATPAIWAADVLTPVTIDEATPSWSGPCWANIATGVPVALHGVTGNDLTGHRLASYPDFLTVATRAGHSTLLAVAGWPPLATTEDGGPLFAEVTRREFVDASEDHGMDAWEVADETITALAVSIIEADAPQASFVYLSAVDIAGHLIQAGADYPAAVRSADQRVGRLIAAVTARPSSENWTTVVVTDHGHLDEGGHGGREPEVLTAWVAVSGPGAAAAQAAVSSHLDIAPLVLRCLSLSGLGGFLDCAGFGVRGLSALQHAFSAARLSGCMTFPAVRISSLAAGPNAAPLRARPPWMSLRPASHGISMPDGRKQVIFDPFSSARHGSSVRNKCHIQDVCHLNGR